MTDSDKLFQALIIRVKIFP